ncbi:hypothetical protein CYMTET_29168 [Cymbomonas tetramitiformis]|uniref:Uncharacterized protein n=1 Tax=Cymbomonas tetramitiformis TaxID=36881 RepID=A0AAE0FLL4_9CHLO|nr:hypothetical protein CYMTET_29168 [Cymbomonas tetramitiformis]
MRAGNCSWKAINEGVSHAYQSSMEQPVEWSGWSGVDWNGVDGVEWSGVVETLPAQSCRLDNESQGVQRRTSCTPMLYLLMAWGGVLAALKQATRGFQGFEHVHITLLELKWDAQVRLRRSSSPAVETGEQGRAPLQQHSQVRPWCQRILAPTDKTDATALAAT